MISANQRTQGNKGRRGISLVEQRTHSGDEIGTLLLIVLLGLVWLRPKSSKHSRRSYITYLQTYLQTYLLGKSKKVYAFGGLSSKEYEANVQN